MVQMTTLYHNPRCTTSRRALALLETSDTPFDVVHYLKTPLDRSGLRALLDRLEDDPADLVRKDKRFKDLGLDAVDYVTAPDVTDLLVEHPELMQRPIVDDGATAFIGRPLDRIDAFTNS